MAQKIFPFRLQTIPNLGTTKLQCLFCSTKTFFGTTKLQCLLINSGLRNVQSVQMHRGSPTFGGPPHLTYRAQKNLIMKNYSKLVDRSKNSSRKDGISHKIGDHKHQFRRKDLGGSNLLSFFFFFFARLFCLVVVRSRN